MSKTILEIMRDNHENLVPVSMTYRGLQPFKEIPGTDTHSGSDTMLWIQNQRPPSSKVPAILRENPTQEEPVIVYVDLVYFSLGVWAQQNMKSNTVSNVVVQRTWRA